MFLYIIFAIAIVIMAGSHIFGKYRCPKCKYLIHKKGTHLYWADIIDNVSGKRLAKYSRAYGFKVY